MPLRRIRTKEYVRTTRRKRGFPLIRIVGGIALLASTGRFLFNHSTDNQTQVTNIQQATVLPEISLANMKKPDLLQKVVEQTTSSYVVQRGDSFFGILTGNDCTRDESALIIKAFRHFNATTLFPGDSLVLKKNSDSTFHSFQFFRRSHEKFTVLNNDSAISVQREQLPVTGYTYIVNGSLKTSLSEAMFEAGVGDIITVGIADIFAWDINFFIDPRKGDSFQVLFDRKVINGTFCGYGAIRAAKYTLSDQKSFYAFGIRDEEGNLQYFDQHGKALQKQFLKAPLRFSRVSSGFTYRRKHPILGIVRPHLGVDYAAPTGTPVHASADGKVAFAGVKGGYGKLVILSHGGMYQTYYGHLHRFGSGIRSGRRVRQGDCIGLVGATGMATGPHLDYRMKKKGRFVNPMTFSSPPLQSIPADRQEEFSAVRQQCMMLFNERFTGHSGSHLVEITSPERDEPQVVVMKKEKSTEISN